jgi:hypothetical protein
MRRSSLSKFRVLGHGVIRSDHSDDGGPGYEDAGPPSFAVIVGEAVWLPLWRELGEAELPAPPVDWAAEAAIEPSRSPTTCSKSMSTSIAGAG